MASNKISILFFGQIVDYTMVTSIELNNIQDTDGVLTQLKYLYPRLNEGPYLVALDKEIIHENTPLTSHHVIALLPPYAGG